MFFKRQAAQRRPQQLVRKTAPGNSNSVSSFELSTSASCNVRTLLASRRDVGKWATQVWGVLSNHLNGRNGNLNQLSIPEVRSLGRLMKCQQKIMKQYKVLTISKRPEEPQGSACWNGAYGRILSFWRTGLHPDPCTFTHERPQSSDWWSILLGSPIQPGNDLVEIVPFKKITAYRSKYARCNIAF